MGEGLFAETGEPVTSRGWLAGCSGRVAGQADLPDVRSWSNIRGMAKQKVTVTLDRSKADTARFLLGAGSTSEVIDLALDRVIRAERLRRDILAYRHVPPTDDDIELALLADTTALDDATDWEALYAEDQK